MRAERDRSMGARILLIAAIAYAWTGLAVCTAACAEAAGLRPGATIQTADAPAGGHAACHGPSAPPAGPEPERSSDPEESVCCCSFDLAAPGEAPGLAPGVAGLPTAPSDDVRDVRASRAAAPAWHPPPRLNSPFDTQNPPLLS